MKSNKKKLLPIVAIMLATLFLCGATNQKEIQLNVADYTSYKEYGTNETKTRSLADGLISYRIPNYWESIETKIDTLPDGYGYQYKLDDNFSDSRVENLSIFYFDIPDYVKEFKDYKEIGGIERAIIENICPDEDLSWYNLNLKHYLFPTESASAFGKKFDYYRASYKNHVVEFVFTEATDGLCVMVYVYKDTDYVDDIMYLISTLNV